MTDLFGISMTYIAGGCIAVTALIFLIVAFIAWRNPVMVKTGLRNIPRRPTQTALIIVGLMLSTLIITAAFGTGDTMSHSITNEVFTMMGPVDEFIEWDTKAHPAAQDKQLIPLADVQKWQEQFKNDPQIKGFLPAVFETMPYYNQRTRLNFAFPTIVATRSADLQRVWGSMKDVDGKTIELAAGDIAVDQSLADKTDTKVGDLVTLLYQGKSYDLTVKAILPNNLVSGSISTSVRQGAAVNYDFLTQVTGRQGMANIVCVSNDGTTRGGIGLSDSAKAKLDLAVKGTNFKVSTVKQDSVRLAQLYGNVFTTLFVVIGLFSIAAGVLLIFLIFIMLAAERKPEMGMARAVGAKRRQIVESFLAEGMGYDFGAALIGLVAGVATASIMIAVVRYGAGDKLGLNLQFSVAPRSLVTAFCLGVITTFIVVFLASWRASRLNIVAAIRDLPESRPANPEAATFLGFLRGTLNGFVAFGYLAASLLALFHFPNPPLYILGLIAAIPGPWIPMLRNGNFGTPRAQRKVGEHIPVWPFILGGATLLLGVGAIILVSYASALLLVRLTRERRPSSIPTWLIVTGILVPPLGAVLAALQTPNRPVAWSVGFGMVGLVTGLMLVQWGLDAGQLFPFALGVSLALLWVAISLRYFHFQERLVFTLTSLAMLAFWYVLPTGWLEWLIGEMNGSIEMFFLSGATLVTCGTFIVVYNADIILPLIASVGARFGRLLPAVKTAVAYPLTSRFRTGLTIAMIGLIMFVLSMESALNTNYAKAFSSDDSLGGFDVRVQVNNNNRTDAIIPAIQKGNETIDPARRVDTTKIRAVGEIRAAGPFDASIKDPSAAVPSPDKEWKQYALLGADAGFIQAQKIPLELRAAGYADDAAVWAAVASGKNFAVVPASITIPPNPFNGPPTGIDEPLSVSADKVKAGFQPFPLTIRDPGTQKLTDVIVIGTMKNAALTFWPGIIMEKGNLLAAVPDSPGQEFYLALQPGTSAKNYAKQVEATLVQASVDSLRQVIDDNMAIQQTFLNMFQGFLALGLIVGIAALGVISTRAVVERRQQIGMLRAIGYKRRMVQLSFLFEAGFVAVSGIALGLGLGLTFAWSLFTSGQAGGEGDSTSGIPFTVPWIQVGAVTAFALVAALVTTWLPARAASRVAVAEALRYE